MVEDAILVWRYKHGSDDALRRIYEKYKRDLLTLSVNLLADTAGAEDIVQDVFAGFVQSARSFRLTGSLKAYLATCAANRARDYLRKRQHRQTVPVREETEASESDNPVRLVIRSEQLRRASLAMGRLAPEQREAIVLRLLGGLRFRQIAQVQGVSTKTAQSRYRSALDKLRSMLDSEVTK